MILVTGALGFIGSHLVDTLLEQGTDPQDIIALDNLGPSANIEYLSSGQLRAIFAPVDLTNIEQLNQLFGRYRIDTIYHLAAESNNNNNIDSLVSSNIMGTLNLLKMVQKYPINNRLVHVSTTTTTPTPTDSPYSATKAASDHLVKAWHHTYGVPTVITRSIEDSSYGPRQDHNKLIPSIIQQLNNNQPVTIRGNIGKWLYVKDHCRALILAAEKGQLGETYNITPDYFNEISNLNLAKMICDIMNKPYSFLIEEDTNKTTNKMTTMIDSSKARTDLGWTDTTSLHMGLATMVGLMM